MKSSATLTTFKSFFRFIFLIFLFKRLFINWTTNLEFDTGIPLLTCPTESSFMSRDLDLFLDPVQIRWFFGFSRVRVEVLIMMTRRFFMRFHLEVQRSPAADTSFQSRPWRGMLRPVDRWAGIKPRTGGSDGFHTGFFLVLRHQASGVSQMKTGLLLRRTFLSRTYQFILLLLSAGMSFPTMILKLSPPGWPHLWARSCRLSRRTHFYACDLVKQVEYEAQRDVK